MLNLMESLLDNWLKNNHMTVDITYYLCIVLVSEGFFTSFSFQTYFSTALILEGAKTLWHQKNYNHGQKSWDRFALLALLRTRQTRIQLHLRNLAPHPPYNVEN